MMGMTLTTHEWKKPAPKPIILPSQLPQISIVHPTSSVNNKIAGEQYTHGQRPSSHSILPVAHLACQSISDYYYYYYCSRYEILVLAFSHKNIGREILQGVHIDLHLCHCGAVQTSFDSLGASQRTQAIGNQVHDEII